MRARATGSPADDRWDRRTSRSTRRRGRTPRAPPAPPPAASLAASEIDRLAPFSFAPAPAAKGPRRRPARRRPPARPQQFAWPVGERGGAILRQVDRGAAHHPPSGSRIPQASVAGTRARLCAPPSLPPDRERGQHHQQAQPRPDRVEQQRLECLRIAGATASSPRRRGSDAGHQQDGEDQVGIDRAGGRGTPFPPGRPLGVTSNRPRRGRSPASRSSGAPGTAPPRSRRSRPRTSAASSGAARALVAMAWGKTARRPA